MTLEADRATPVMRGAYKADRAAALAGVPISTLYYWASHDIFAPSVSRSKVKLWSWADLIALRAVYWLRSKKPEDATRPTTMAQVREFLSTVDSEYGEHLGSALAEKALLLRVDRAGRIHLNIESRTVQMISINVTQVTASELLVDLLSEFDIHAGARGPHLITPRPRLRIMPGKLGGEPHVLGTRLDTRSISALLNRGMPEHGVLELYPFLEARDIEQALDLEDQLATNLVAFAA